MNKKYKVAVIGAGASGLTACVEAARRFGGENVILLEKQQKIGRKLLATGNGRCNISNADINETHYYGDKKIISSVIGEFGVKKLKRFFSDIGLLLKEDGEGRLYPYSNQAVTVLDCIKNELSRSKVNIICGFAIKSIEHKKDGYFIVSYNEKILAENIIIACGSKASPSLGANDSGFALLKNLGIVSTDLFPALLPINTYEKCTSLKGVRAKGTVYLLADGKIIRSKSGEIQFNENGLSGICIFECSRAVNEYFLYGKIFGEKINTLTVELDVMHDLPETDICKYLRNCRSLFGEQSCEIILSGALHKQLSKTIVDRAGVDRKICKELNENDIQKIAYTAKHLSFKPLISDNFKTAQVCAGGITSEYVSPETLMSKKHKGLFICGEMLDVDGDCGGYNLHFAVSSALKAVKNIK